MVRFGFVFLFFTTSCLFSLAQVVPDTTHISIGDKTIIVIDSNPTDKTEPASPGTIDAPTTPESEIKNQLTHFAGIDFGFCQLIDANGSVITDLAIQSYREKNPDLSRLHRHIHRLRNRLQQLRFFR
jgi:hypothetical protein